MVKEKRQGNKNKRNRLRMHNDFLLFFFVSFICSDFVVHILEGLEREKEEKHQSKGFSREIKCEK
jgi:hypothetical protein